MTVELIPTRDAERDFFIANLQTAFRRADGTDKFRTEDLPQFFAKTNAVLLDIIGDGKFVGGAVVVIRPSNCNRLPLFFVNADVRNRGIGFAAWQAIEKFFPATKVWETSTPWLDKRNLHFYLNKCGFHAVSIYAARRSIRCTDEEIYMGLQKFMR